MNLRSQLDNIDVQEKDGSITNLGEKYGKQNKTLGKNICTAERSIRR